jgi:hypothetical protein
MVNWPILVLRAPDRLRTGSTRVSLTDSCAHDACRPGRLREFAHLMEQFRAESGARNAFDVDAFFYDYWEQHIKNQGKH